MVKNPLTMQEIKETQDGKISGGGHGNPLQYPCLEKPMDPWWATVHTVAKSQT